ncbi:MAG TPA: hypothetical protein VJ570_05615 [Holophagaceae bacterium]|nr:hypothetical protein [Holophagaceae bacterium]
MADSNWDSPAPAVPKPGMPLWGKILVGCGVLFLLVMGSCVALGIYAGKHPEKIKNAVGGWGMSFLKPEWDDLRATVEALRTEEGGKALYTANPALAKQWATQEDFLKEAREWREQLPELPAELTVDLLEHQDLSLNNQFGGEMHVIYRKKGGLRIELAWDRARKKGDTRPRRLVHLEVS